MKSAVQRRLSLTCAVSLVFAISSCSRGGGEGTTPLPVSTTTQTILSGTVQAPGGQVAFFKKPGFDDWLASEAYAAVIGLAPVSDGTTVELGRIDHTAPFSFSSISSTTTSGGRYTFNLTSLGLSPDIDLMVQVENGATKLRAFVTGTTIHISQCQRLRS
jgi:hypothetical protein